jgi:hypothetical protein
VAATADDQVVVDGDRQLVGGLDDLAGDLDIGARRGRVARWVVVHQDDGGCRELERALDDLADIDRCMVDGALLLYLVGDKIVLTVEKQVRNCSVSLQAMAAVQ